MIEYMHGRPVATLHSFACFIIHLIMVKNVHYTIMIIGPYYNRLRWPEFYTQIRSRNSREKIFHCKLVSIIQLDY